VYGIRRKSATKFTHFTWKVSLHYLVKFRAIIVTSLLQKMDSNLFKMFQWRSIGLKASNKNCKVNGAAIGFLCNNFLCYFYSRSLYCFNQSLCRFFGKKWVALKSRLTGCWMVWENGLADSVKGAVRNDPRPWPKICVFWHKVCNWLCQVCSWLCWSVLCEVAKCNGDFWRRW